MTEEGLAESLRGMTIEARPPPSLKTHKTVHEAYIPSTQRREIKTLTDTCLAYLAHHSCALCDIRGLDEVLTIRLLREIVIRGKLDVRLCKIFMSSGHESISSVVNTLDLFAALSCSTQLSACRR